MDLLLYIVTKCRDVRDVAMAHIAATEKSTASGRYCLCSETLNFKDCLDSIRESYPKESKRIPSTIMSEEMLGLFTTTLPPAEGSFIKSLAGKFPRVNNRRSSIELELDYTSPEKTLKDTAEWIIDHGYHLPDEAPGSWCCLRSRRDAPT